MRVISSAVQRLAVGEVEAQTVGADERALLLRLLAEHRAQRPVEEVRRRVVAPRRRAARVVDLEVTASPDGDRALRAPCRCARRAP